MATNYIAIENADGSIQLYDLYSNYSHEYTPCLEFNNATSERTWDNHEYLFKFFRGIKKNKKEYCKDLKEFCEENKLDYQQTLKDLLDIYHDSKKLNFWNRKDVKNEILKDVIKRDKLAEKIKDKMIKELLKPDFNSYLIMTGVRLTNYSYDIQVVLENINYFKECYDGDIGVYIALDNFDNYIHKV